MLAILNETFSVLSNTIMLISKSNIVVSYMMMGLALTLSWWTAKLQSHLSSNFRGCQIQLMLSKPQDQILTWEGGWRSLKKLFSSCLPQTKLHSLETFLWLTKQQSSFAIAHKEQFLNEVILILCKSCILLHFPLAEKFISSDSSSEAAD